MVSRSPRRRRASKSTPRVRGSRSAYVLIVRDESGSISCERFRTAGEYRLRLAMLDETVERGLSIDQIASLLDP